MSRESMPEYVPPILALGGLVGVLVGGLFTKQYIEEPVRFPAAAKNIERIQPNIKQISGIYAEVPHEDRGQVDCGANKIVLFGVLPLVEERPMRVIADIPTEGIDTVHCDVEVDRSVVID